MNEIWNINNRAILNKINKSTKFELNNAIGDATDIEILKIIKALKSSKHTLNKLVYSIDTILVERYFNKINNKDMGNYINILLSDEKLFSFILNLASSNLRMRLLGKIRNKEDKEYWNNHLIEKNSPRENNSIKEINTHQIDQKSEYIKELNIEIQNKENNLKQLSIQKEEHVNLLEQELINIESKQVLKRKELQSLNSRLEFEEQEYNKNVLNLEVKYKDLLEREQQKLKSQKDNTNKEIENLLKQETDLTDSINKLISERESQVSKSLQLKIPEYVDNAINKLTIQEKDFNKKAYLWNIFGIIALSFSVLISIVSFIYSYDLISANTLDWKIFIYLVFKGLIIIAIFIIFARYAFNVASSYTHESLKRNERIHAITFGKLFLEIYGKDIEQKEMRDIFSNWTIDVQSSFLNNKNTLDEPKILEYFKELNKVLQKKDI